MVRASDKTFSGISGINCRGGTPWPPHGLKHALFAQTGRPRSAAPTIVLQGVKLFLLLFFRRVDDDLYATSRWQATDHLGAIDLRQLAAGRVPKFDPERARRSMNCESRTIEHHRNGLCHCSLAQCLQQLRNVRLELVKLDQHRSVINLSRRQLHRIFRLQQKPRLGLFVALLNDWHSFNSLPEERRDMVSNASADV